MQDLFVESILEPLFVSWKVISRDAFINGFKTLKSRNMGVEIGCAPRETDAETWSWQSSRPADGSQACQQLLNLTRSSRSNLSGGLQCSIDLMACQRLLGLREQALSWFESAFGLGPVEFGSSPIE